MSEKKYGALPSGALVRHVGPICALLALFALGRHMGVSPYFFGHLRE